VKRVGLFLLVLALLVGCTTRRQSLVEPVPPSVRSEAPFPEPTAAQSNQLARLDSLLRGPVARLDLSWVSDMGSVAIPACAREAANETLSFEARDLILIVLGNTLQKAKFSESHRSWNDLVVPVLLKALADTEPRVRRSAAYAARFVDDARLVPALRALLRDDAPVQEQAVLALGMSGREAEVTPVATLFFTTESGKFRYSCLYSLATMCLLHGVDVATVLETNMASFGQKNVNNVESVRQRFVAFKAMTELVQQLSLPDSSERKDANEKLHKLTGQQVTFDPAGNDAERQRGIEEWRKYLLKDYWLVPSPSKP
jgi:hypothetical protein